MIISFTENDCHSNFNTYILLQDEAALEVHPFIPLIKIECSPDLKVIDKSKYQTFNL